MRTTNNQKRLEFSRESLAGRSKGWMKPGEESVSLKQTSQFCQLARLPAGETGPKAMMSQWWAGLDLAQVCLLVQSISSALYLNLRLTLGIQRWIWDH